MRQVGAINSLTALVPPIAVVDVEITPEMIEVGESILLGELGGAVTSFWSAPDLAVSVYRAMASLRSEGSE